MQHHPRDAVVVAYSTGGGLDDVDSGEGVVAPAVGVEEAYKLHVNLGVIPR